MTGKFTGKIVEFFKGRDNIIGTINLRLSDERIFKRIFEMSVYYQFSDKFPFFLYAKSTVYYFSI